MRAIVISLALGGLTGCTPPDPARIDVSSPEPAAAAVVEPTATPAAQLSSDEDAWRFVERADDEAALYFGPDESDNLPIGMACRRGSRQIDVHLYLDEFQPPADREAPWPTTATLAADDLKASYPFEVEYDGEVMDAYYASTSVSSGDPVLARFRRSGRLSSPVGMEGAYPAESSAERANIERFFAHCEV